MIDVLMSTFNGERFLAVQIRSILEQGGPEFRLTVRDDGSTDGTLRMLEDIARSDRRVTLRNDGLGNIGARRSFMKLVEAADADYFMLADQDDVWLPGKIERSAAMLREFEEQHGPEVPLLVFTDLLVADEELGQVAPSFWQYQKLDPQIASEWRDLLAQNVVTGCTIIANRAARAASLPFALPQMMHDHWIAVNVSRAGKVAWLSEPTVLYRQHESNLEGARHAGVGYFARKILEPRKLIGSFMKAAAHFGDVSAADLARRKIRLNRARLA